jgi:hypothetical protein
MGESWPGQTTSGSFGLYEKKNPKTVPDGLGNAQTMRECNYSRVGSKGVISTAGCESVGDEADGTSL